MKLIKFPSISQFRNVVHDVIHRAQYVDKDDQGNVTLDTTRPLPTLKFEGTVKLHGTNAAIVRNSEGEMWAQSRENVITPLKDNAGFAMFVEANKPAFSNLMDIVNRDVLSSQVESLRSCTIAVYGEWCGKGIQKTVAISQLPKMFVIFGIAIRPKQDDSDEEYRIWLDSQGVMDIYRKAFAGSEKVRCIYEFPTYSVEIDFSRPHDFQNQLVDLTLAVEEECPVGKALGATPENGLLTGEGIVWKCVTPGYANSRYWFKTKGERHSAGGGKVTTLAPVDVERIDNINKLAETLTPAWRLEQMITQTFDTLNGGCLDIRRMGDYIKAVMQDIIKEELDTLAVSGFSTKDVTGAVSKIARSYLMEQLNNFQR